MTHAALFFSFIFIFLNFSFDYPSFGLHGILVPLISQLTFLLSSFYLSKRRVDFKLVPFLFNASFIALLLHIVNINIAMMLNTSQFKFLYFLAAIALSLLAIYSILTQITFKFALYLIVLNSSVLFLPVYLDIGGSTLTSIAILSTLLYAILTSKIKFMCKDPYNIILMLFILWITLSTIFSSYYGSTIVAYLKIFGFITLSILIGSIDIRELKGIFYGFLTIAILISIFSLIHVGERIYYMGLSDGLNHRLFLDDIHPSHLADFVVLLMPFLINFVVKKKGLTGASEWASKISILGLILTLLLILFTTFSRSCWLGILLGFLIYSSSSIYINLKIYKLKDIFTLRNIFVASILIIIFSLLFYSKPVQNRIKGKLNIEGIKGSGRFADWGVTLKMVKDNPILGNGLETRPFLYSKYKLDPAYRHISGYFVGLSHNVFLGIASDIGVIGLILFITIILFSLIRMALILRWGSNLTIMPASVIASIISVMPSFLAGTLLDTSHILFWIILGLAQNLCSKYKNELFPLPSQYKESQKNTRWMRFLIIGMLIVITLINLIRFYSRYENRMGEELFQLKKYNEALFHFKRANFIFPFSSHYDFSLAETFEKIGSVEEAKKSYEGAISKNPTYAKYYAQYAIFLNSIGEYRDAIQKCKIAIELDPYLSSGKYYFDLGVIQLQHNNLSGINNIKEALQIEPGLAKEFAKKYGKNKLVEIVTILEEEIAGLENSEKKERLLLRVPVIYGAISETPEQKKFYQFLEENYKESFFVLVRLIRFYRVTENFIKCSEISSDALERGVSDPVFFNEAGMCYFANGEYKKAKDLFKKSLNLWEEIHLYNYIAYKYLELIYREENDEINYKISLKRTKYLDRHLDYDFTKMKQNQPDSYILEQFEEIY